MAVPAAMRPPVATSTAIDSWPMEIPLTIAVM
jgi:hypothetical protein